MSSSSSSRRPHTVGVSIRVSVVGYVVSASPSSLSAGTEHRAGQAVQTGPRGRERFTIRRLEADSQTTLGSGRPSTSHSSLLGALSDPEGVFTMDSLRIWGLPAIKLQKL